MCYFCVPFSFSFLPLSSSRRHTTEASRPSFLQNGSQHRPLGHSSQHRPLGSGSVHRALGHSSQHRGLATAAAVAAAAAEGSRASGGLGDIRVMKVIILFPPRISCEPPACSVDLSFQSWVVLSWLRRSAFFHKRDPFPPSKS